MILKFPAYLDPSKRTWDEWYHLSWSIATDYGNRLGTPWSQDTYNRVVVKFYEIATLHPNYLDHVQPEAAR